jgi:hypothetical protein
MPEKKKMGFSAMSEEKRKAIASKGGKTAHEVGKAYEWDSDTARATSKKGWDEKKGSQ